MRGEERDRPQEPRQGFTAVGRVLRPHGIRGEIRVQSFSESAVNLRPGKFVYLDGVRRRVDRARHDRGAWILRLRGLTTRNDVEGFRGALLEVPDDEVERESEDSYFLHELIGLRVVTKDGEELGDVVDVLQPGANDVYVVQGPRGEVLVPAIGDVIEQIDVAGGVIVITPLPGMLDESKYPH